MSSNKNKTISVRPAYGRTKPAKLACFSMQHGSAVELLATGRDIKNPTEFIKHSEI